MILTGTFTRHLRMRDVRERHYISWSGRWRDGVFRGLARYLESLQAWSGGSGFFLKFLHHSVLVINPNDFVETLESDQRVFVTGSCAIAEQ